MSPLLLCATALAWNSSAGGEHGMAAAREPWTDEHAEFQAIALGALQVQDPGTTLRVYTNGAEVEGEETVAPAASWVSVAAVQDRTFTLSGFANLPDLAWSLAGWLGGNETCPVSGAPLSSCYGNTGWLTAINADHFLPQAQWAYQWYHDLALDTADRCTSLAAAFEAVDLADPDAAGEAVTQCEAEAFMFEGAAEHFLQDAQASAHQWQRWGSNEITAWTGADPGEALVDALVVGLHALLVHGPGPIEAASFYLLHIPLLSGDDVTCRAAGGASTFACVGDGHAGELDAAALATEHDRLWACNLGSVDEVVARLPGSLGGVSAGFTRPSDEVCFGTRVTNGAMRASMLFGSLGPGGTLSFLAKLVFDGPTLLALKAAFPTLSDLHLTDVQTGARMSVVRTAVLLMASRWSARNPDDGTNLADMVLNRDNGTTLEIQVGTTRPNGAYEADYAQGLSTFDPPVAVLTGAAEGSASQERDAEIIRRALPLAHIDSWCAQDLSPDIAGLATLCRAPSNPEEAREAACGACGMLGSWIWRSGDPSGEIPPEADALCDAFEGGGTTRLYMPEGRAPTAAGATGFAQAWCLAGGTSHFTITAVNPADAGVDADAVLSDYFTLIEAKIIGCLAYSDYMLTLGAYSLAEYYQVLANNFGYDLIAVAKLLASARFTENGLARWQGGAVEDDYYGAIADLDGYSEHAFAPGADAMGWDDLLADLPTQTVLFALSAEDEYPFLFMADAKVTMDEDGTRALRLRNMLFITTTYLHDAQLTLMADEVPVATLDNIVFSAEEVTLHFTPAGTLRLAFDVTGLGLDDGSLYTDTYDNELSFRILALDLAADSPVFEAGAGLH